MEDSLGGIIAKFLLSIHTERASNGTQGADYNMGANFATGGGVKTLKGLANASYETGNLAPMINMARCLAER